MNNLPTLDWIDPFRYPDMIIYIPTLGRVDTQLTWNLIPPEWKARTVFVVPPDEARSHRDRGRDNLLICPAQGNISRVREVIVRVSKMTEIQRIGILDDDLIGFVHTDRPSEGGLNRKGTPKDWAHVVHWIHRTLDTVPHCGLQLRLNPPWEKDVSISGRLGGNHFFDLDTLPIDSLDWTGCPFAEDLHLSLQLIRLGLPTHVHNRYRFSTTRTATPGGCQTGGRTTETHNRTMEKLISLHHPYVSRAAKVGGEGRIKVRIRWQSLWKDVQAGKVGPI